MPLQVVSSVNNVKVYDITSAAKTALPDWIAKTNKKSLQRDIEYRNRLELIQDFEFPEASIKLKSTRDGNHIIATGVYKPQMRVFELRDLALKFDRHTDAENVQFEILSDDWTKSVHLQNDRSIEFHTQFGCHFKTRVPRFGRDMAYHYPSCDLMVGGASNEVWRLNLEQGRFMTSLPTDLSGINICSINPAHQLWAFGGEEGDIEFWHPTTKQRIAKLDVSSILRQSPEYSETFDSTGTCEITCVKFADDGLTFSVGVSTGQVLVYDLRRPTPIIIKDHQYGFPIKNIIYHGSGNIVSADTKIVKIWDKNNGDMFTSVEPQNDINDILIDKDAGLLMIANEGVRIQSYYIPQLGPAPKWCPFLDNMTEELEENPHSTVYDDYKFVTRKELNTLGLDHLVGTNLLRAYMHGYFVDLRLYEKARSILNPFDFEDFKKSQVDAKMQKERESRISVSAKNRPKINRALADKLIQGENALTAVEDSKKNKKSKSLTSGQGTASNPLGDSRFADLFKDSEFEIDMESREYKLHHPTESTKKPSILDSFDALDEEDEEEEEEEEDELDEEVSTPTTNTIGKKPSHSFYELKTGVNVSKLNDRNNGSSAAASLLKSTFEDRIKSCQNDTGLMTAIARKSGNMSLTFKPNRNQYGKSDLESVHRGGGDDGDDDKNARRKRGVGSLKLQGGGGSGGGFSGGRGGRGGGRGRGGRGRGGRGGGRGSSRGGGGSRGGGRGSSRGRH